METEDNNEIMRDNNGFFYDSQGKCFQDKKVNLLKDSLWEFLKFDHEL